MELQWPLILFTTLTAWACGVFGAQGVLALKGAGKKSQQLLAVVLAAKGEDTGALGVPAIVGSAVGAVCTAAYAIYIQMAGGSFSEVGNYFDPTHPTKAMVDAGAAIGDQAVLLWLGAIVPLVCCFLAKKKGDANAWKLFGAVAAVAALVGAICLRVVFYGAGLSVFMFY